MAQFKQACQQLEQFAKYLEEEEAALQDVPDEFLGAYAHPEPAWASGAHLAFVADALVFTIMRDPVRLPSSGMIVDRTTIRQHLLNDEVRMGRKPCAWRLPLTGNACCAGYFVDGPVQPRPADRGPGGGAARAAGRDPCVARCQRQASAFKLGAQRWLPDVRIAGCLPPRVHCVEAEHMKALR